MNENAEFYIRNKQQQTNIKFTTMSKEYWIKVGHVDNRLVIYLNGETIWDSGLQHDDPDVHKLVEITNLLHDKDNFHNELIFEGFNDTFNGSENEMCPWHFSYQVLCVVKDSNGKVVEEKDLIKPYDEKHYSNPNIKALNNAYVLKMKDGEYKVVSNALSQKFTV